MKLRGAASNIRLLWLRSEMGGNGTGTGGGQAGGGERDRGGLRRQTGSSCMRAGGQAMSGEGWIKQINT